MFKKYLVPVLVTLFVFIGTGIAYADGPEDVDDNGSLGNEAVPIDGGISLLVAAGVGYGAKKIHDGRKKRENMNKE